MTKNATMTARSLYCHRVPPYFVSKKHLPLHLADDWLSVAHVSTHIDFGLFLKCTWSLILYMWVSIFLFGANLFISQTIFFWEKKSWLMMKNISSFIITTSSTAHQMMFRGLVVENCFFFSFTDDTDQFFFNCRLFLCARRLLFFF